MNNIDKTSVIAVAGMIGVGKSTFAKKISEMLDFQVMYENVDNNPYLDKYYLDFERWSFNLQIFFLAERFKDQKRMFSYGGGYITDRTIYEDLEIFAKINFDNEKMTNDDWNTYNSLFQAMVLTPFFNEPDIVIYLEGSFEEILERIKLRNRPSEQNVDIEYFRELHNRYQKWIESFDHAKVLRININNYDIDNEESMVGILKRIETVINS